MLEVGLRSRRMVWQYSADVIEKNAMVCSPVNVKCSFRPYFSPSASDCGRRSLESGATWIEWQGIGFALDNHNSAVYALKIICNDFGDAIEAQKTMTTRSIIVIPKLNQTRFFWFEVKYVSKVISEPRNETGVADSVTFRTKTAVRPHVGGGWAGLNYLVYLV